MAIEYEYFRIYRENNTIYPIITSIKNGEYQYETDIIKNPQPMEFIVKSKGNRKYKVVDFHRSPYTIVSKKIYDVLCKINIEGVQHIPAAIIGKKDERYENYYYVHICNYISALDKEKSIYKWDNFINTADIEKLYIDKTVLEKIPLEKRLVFKLKENPIFEIYHKSIVDKIMETKPEGIHFSGILGWHIENNFK